ncbi:hypothetical protein UZ36_00730 [Candidatus Nitromaritima sp. SCGC AAA799-C22]|nr:hypothetical protein UZ36_00730 [Candidatus Nitromaritima sp. SCGC AAA799-C22]
MSPRTDTILWVLLLIFLWAPVPGEAQEVDSLPKIARANESYHEKNYTAAAEIYEALIASGHHNGYLYYNLGNTYMRLGQTGRGVFNYLRAKTLLPRDENLEANLRYAVHQTVDQIEPPPGGFLTGILFWMKSLNLSEHFQLLIGFNFLYWFLSIGWLFYRKPMWNIVRKTAMTFLILVAVSTGAKYYFQTQQTTGVVLANKVNIKSDKGAQNVTLFQLHEGAIITVDTEDGGWVRISLGSDKSGWAPKETVGF